MDEDEVIGPALGEDEGTAYAVVADLLRSSEHPKALTIPIHGNNAELFLMLARRPDRAQRLPIFLLLDGRCAAPELHPLGRLHGVTSKIADPRQGPSS
ncbi:MAG: hypothetical protein ACXWXN_08295 [Actinomycetota bacterium]